MSQSSAFFLADAPESLALSLNGVEGQTGPRFKGFATLPVGFNFLAYHESSSTASPFPAIIWWITSATENTHASSVALFRWNSQDAVFVKDPQLQDTSPETFEDNFLRQSNALIPYARFMRHQDGSEQLWLGLTNFIVLDVVEQVLGQHSKIIGLSNSSQLEFSSIPSVKEFALRHRLSAAEITRLALDSSPILESFQAHNLLAELQLSFIIFKYCMNMDCFDVWMRLVRLFCNSTMDTRLAQAFVSAVLPQLQLVHEDASLLEYYISDPLPLQLFTGFIQLNEDDCCLDLRPLKEALSGLFGWSFASEDVMEQ